MKSKRVRNAKIGEIIELIRPYSKSCTEQQLTDISKHIKHNMAILYWYEFTQNKKLLEDIVNKIERNFKIMKRRTNKKL